MENTPMQSGPVAALAGRVDCFTEDELAALAGVRLTTLEAWRKRGKGPAYILFGCHYLYPRKETANHLESLIRKAGQGAKGTSLL